MEPTQELIEIEPERALDKYLEHREAEEVSDSTLRAHRYRLQHFVRWCDKEEISSLSELNSRDIQEYRYWRKADGDLNNVSWHTQMTTFRVFLKWAETYQAVPNSFHKQLEIPSLDPDEDARDETFDEERSEAILNHLEKFEYATKKHALFKLLWHTGMRIGAARTLDVDDFHPDDQYIEIHHRPESSTPLKNRDKGERPISLSSDVVQVLKDYIETNRPDVTDRYGRSPLFATRSGRAHTTTLRETVYRLARPCTYRDGFCPHDKDPAECEAAQRSDDASKCPSSFSPHTIRRSSITKWLGDDVPMEAVSDRMNANEDALEKHYDKRSPKGKMDQRRDYFI